MDQSHSTSNTVIVLGNVRENPSGFIPPLAPIGTLPAVLRMILGVQTVNVSRTVLCVDSRWASILEKNLRKTGRLPRTLDWYLSDEDRDLGLLTRRIGATGNVIFILGDRSYRPSLLKRATEWNALEGALAFLDHDELVGIYVVSKSMAAELANDYGVQIKTLEDLHQWVQSRGRVEIEQVEDQSWQKLSCPADQLNAENKLDKWLVKPTDGMFARMNRRVSIPISRWLLKFPVTPNMVTFFTLWVSFGAGLFFAYGGYWATLIGAVLSVWASILDGCDGEVARLKLQVTDFGCWLETICDYLYYVFVFGGMIIGLTRTMGAKFTLTWGPMLLFGAIASFLAVGFARHHFSSDRPEAFLSIWQKKAENRKANPLLYVGRHCEFIIRRCFLPYAFLAFALFNILPIAFVTAAIGANIVWCIALYSCFALSRRREWRTVAGPSRSHPTTEVVTN